MKIAILRERVGDETRVAATPETVAKLIALGASVSVEKNAGMASRIPDIAFKEAGASIVANASAAVNGADVLLVVRRPSANAVLGMAKGALVIGTMDPYGNEKDIATLAKAGVSAIAMEFMPRITRAQSMDILSSQANLAGYQAVIEAAAVFDRAMPMMMTAAGTVRPAKVFVMGAGVAGLQAIATAKRLGAVVTATDVRPASKEQVESLGGKFVAVEDDEFKQAETAGGYAKEMSKDYQAKQAQLVAAHIAKQDIVITTALIPGRPAPKLVSKAMVESMAPGSVVVDLAAERGGNCELTKPGQVVEHNAVILVGYTNLAGRIATSASQLYARNLLTFLDTLIDKETKKISVDWDDELVKATVLTRNGAVVHPNFAASAAPASAKKTAVAKVAAQKTAVAKVAPKKTAVAKTASSTKAVAKTSAAKKPTAKKPVVKKPVVKKAVPTKPLKADAPLKGGAVAKTAKTAPKLTAEKTNAAPVKTGAASKTSAAKKPSTAKTTVAKPRVAKTTTAKTGVKKPAVKKAPAKKPAAPKSAPQKSGDV